MAGGHLSSYQGIQTRIPATRTSFANPIHTDAIFIPLPQGAA